MEVRPGSDAIIFIDANIFIEYHSWRRQRKRRGRGISWWWVRRGKVNLEYFSQSIMNYFKNLRHWLVNFTHKKKFPCLSYVHMHKNNRRPWPPIFLSPSPTPWFSERCATATPGPRPLGFFLMRGRWAYRIREEVNIFFLNPYAKKIRKNSWAE